MTNDIIKIWYDILWHRYWLRCGNSSESQNIPLQRAVAGFNLFLNRSCNFMSWFRQGIMKDMISTSHVRALVTVSFCWQFCLERQGCVNEVWWRMIGQYSALLHWISGSDYGCCDCGDAAAWAFSLCASSNDQEIHRNLDALWPDLAETNLVEKICEFLRCHPVMSILWRHTLGVKVAFAGIILDHELKSQGTEMSDKKDVVQT